MPQTGVLIRKTKMPPRGDWANQKDLSQPARGFSAPVPRLDPGLQPYRFEFQAHAIYPIVCGAQTVHELSVDPSIAPSFLDAFHFHKLLSLEPGRWLKPVPDVLAHRVLEHLDVIEYVLPGLLACFPISS